MPDWSAGPAQGSCLPPLPRAGGPPLILRSAHPHLLGPARSLPPQSGPAPPPAPRPPPPAPRSRPRPARRPSTLASCRPSWPTPGARGWSWWGIWTWRGPGRSAGGQGPAAASSPSLAWTMAPSWCAERAGGGRGGGAGRGGKGPRSVGPSPSGGLWRARTVKVLGRGAEGGAVCRRRR